MMPINLRVKIEQRAIPRLLAECANSSMPIDVRAVREFMEESSAMDSVAALAVRPGGPGGPSGPGGGHMGPPAGAYQGMGMGMPGGPSPMGMQRVGAGDVHTTEEEESADPSVPTVPVEIQGIIYIYNPPDKAKVGTGTAKAKTASGAKAASTAAPKPGTPATGGHP